MFYPDNYKLPNVSSGIANTAQRGALCTHSVLVQPKTVSIEKEKKTPVIQFCI
jgi:hypothetical protein